MIKKRSLITIALVAFFLIPATYTIYGQSNCNCKEANQELFDNLTDNDDSTGVYLLVNKLKKGGDNVCLVMAYNLEMDYLYHHRKVDAVWEVLQKQEKLIASLACKTELQIQVYLNYARYYKAKEDYENLSRFAFKALENAETRNDAPGTFKAIKFIVYLFTRQEQDEKTWPYIKQAEAIILKQKEDYATAVDYNWLAFEYENKYTQIERATLIDSAIAFANKAKAVALKYSNYEQIVQSFRVSEACAYHRGDLRKAVASMDSALLYAKKIKIPINLSSLYLAKAWDLIDLKEFTEATRWQDTSIFYAEKFEPGSPATMRVYFESTKIFEAAGNLPKAYAAFKKYDHVKDSIFNLQRTEKINELEQKYEKTKNEKTIKELAQQKRIYLLLALAGLLGLVALAFFLRQQSLKNKQKIMDTEQRLNRARMNPHFFFNALSSLQSFALQENDGKALASNLSKFSHIMRETLESTYKEYVTIEQEADFLEEYLGLQRIRFPQKFSYEIDIAANIEADEMLIPSMILQPFVENSIEHGFTGIDYPGMVSISFTKDAKDLHITITDNGKGLATTPKENSEHISRASQIIKDRIFLLNIKLKTRASFSIDNNKQGQGVMVKIMLPVLHKSDVKNESTN